MGNCCNLYEGHHNHQSGGHDHDKSFPTKDLGPIRAAYDYDGVKLECTNCKHVKQAMQECEKHKTQHEKFCLVNSLSEEWLPSTLRDQDTINLIKVLSYQTCLIQVAFVSRDRPINDECYKSRDENKCRVGSGFVHINNIDVKEIKDTNIQAPGSSSSGSSNNATCYGPLIIQTAKHLVYDESEMLNTKIYFYLDEDNESQAIEVTPRRVVGCDPSDDRIELECVTNDETLGVRLKQARSERNGLWRKFVNKSSHGSEIIAVCISHIHGSCSKYISIGKCMEMVPKSKEERYLLWRYFVYDTPTCAGSSGAPVWICKQDGFFHACVSHSSHRHTDSLGQSSQGAIVQTSGFQNWSAE